MFSNFAKWLAKYVKLWPGCFLNMKFGMCQVCDLAGKTSNMWIGQKHFAEKGFDLSKKISMPTMGPETCTYLEYIFVICTLLLLIAWCIPNIYIYVESFLICYMSKS